MNDPLFLTLDEVLSLHAEQIRRFGGSPGIRDLGLLERRGNIRGSISPRDDLLDGCHISLWHLSQSSLQPPR